MVGNYTHTHSFILSNIGDLYVLCLALFEIMAFFIKITALLAFYRRTVIRGKTNAVIFEIVAKGFLLLFFCRLAKNEQISNKLCF